MRATLTFILDLLFTLIISFAISFILFSYFLKREYSILYSLLIALLLSAVFFKARKGRNAKKKISMQEKRKVDGVISALQFMPLNQTVKLFVKGIKAQNLTPVIRRNEIFIQETKTLYLLKFEFENTTKADIMKAFNQKGVNIVRVFSEGFDGEITEFATRFNGKIILSDKLEVYQFLSEASALPTITETPPKEKKFKRIITEFFKKKKAVKYLLFGLSFLGFSFLTTYKLYYVTFGCALLIFSLLCRLIGKGEET